MSAFNKSIVDPVNSMKRGTVKPSDTQVETFINALDADEIEKIIKTTNIDINIKIDNKGPAEGADGPIDGCIDGFVVGPE